MTFKIQEMDATLKDISDIYIIDLCTIKSDTRACSAACIIDSFDISRHCTS